MDGSSLIGHRVELRPLNAADEAVLAGAAENGRAWATPGYAPHAAAHAAAGTGGADFAIVARKGGSLIGAAGLHDLCAEDRTALLGLLIADAGADMRGSLGEVTGLLAQVAFEHLQLNRIELAVTDLQQRDLYACWGAGFEFEGRSKQAVYRDGAFRDLLRYGLLRQKWESMRPAATRSVLPV